MSSSKILIGTASWSDPEFVRDWYPSEINKTDLLAWYAQHFSFVEVNSSFYGIPKRQTVDNAQFSILLCWDNVTGAAD